MTKNHKKHTPQSLLKALLRKSPRALSRLLETATFDCHARAAMQRLFMLDDNASNDLFRAVFGGQTVDVSSHEGMLRILTRFYELGVLEIYPPNKRPKRSGDVKLRLTARPLLELITSMRDRDPETSLSKTIERGDVPHTTESSSTKTGPRKAAQ